MKTRVRILFVFRRSKKMSDKSAATVGGIPVAADEVGSIYCRITVAGKCVNFSTNCPEVTYGEWNSQAQRVVGKKHSASVVNAAITKMADQLTDIWADLERQKKPVTAQSIQRIYRKGGTAALSLLELYEAWVAERKTLVGIEISYASLEQGQTRFNRLTEFLAQQRATDLRPEEMTHNMADRLLHWLLKERGFARGTANKVISTVGQVLRWGVRREYVEKNPLMLYQFKAAAPPEIKYLTSGELQLLTDYDMPYPYLARARDCFVFQCWTGLAYADLMALDVARDADYVRSEGTNTMYRVLRIRRQKSTMSKGFECTIPLLPEAERLLAKYGDQMPVVTNQAYNRFLKEIGQLCGLAEDKMTTHVGRKTAGTLMLNMGIPLPEVSKFLGHSNTIITQKLYAKLLDKTVVDSFSRVFGGGMMAPAAPLALAPPQPPQLLVLPPAPPAYDPQKAAIGERMEKWGTHSNKPTTRPANRIRVRDLFMDKEEDQAA